VQFLEASRMGLPLEPMALLDHVAHALPDTLRRARVIQLADCGLVPAIELCKCGQRALEALLGASSKHALRDLRVLRWFARHGRLPRFGAAFSIRLLRNALTQVKRSFETAAQAGRCETMSRFATAPADLLKLN
jgi:hypothetical protein